MPHKLNELLIATSNKGKLKEVESYLSNQTLTLLTLAKFPSLQEPEETGETFSDNAILKAVYYSNATNLWTIADDSGLEVDALDARPGVYSARYAGKGATDRAKIKRLLLELENIPTQKRTARFVCSLAFCSPDGEVLKVTTGTCEGRIGYEPKGTNGFGYDPVFIPLGYDDSFGELSLEIKQNISHRAVALRQFSLFFKDFLIS